MRDYRAVVSSDWNECLAPCRPFDVVRFTHPGLSELVDAVTDEYTSSTMTYGAAARIVRRMLPGAITPAQMDAYLAAHFAVYPGLPQFIEWCDSHAILFMINTTGMIGYFQRVFAAGLLRIVPALSAHPMVRYPALRSDPEMILDLGEIEDKPRNTEAVMQAPGVATRKVVIMGDSGGDGPHFAWGTRIGALLIASRPKPSLRRYCDERGIRIDVELQGEAPGGGGGDNFMQLVPAVERFIGR